MGEFITFLGNNLADFWTYTGFANATVGHVGNASGRFVFHILGCSQGI